LLDGTLDQLRKAQQRLSRREQVNRINPHVNETLLDGSYKIIKQHGPSDAQASTGPTTTPSYPPTLAANLTDTPQPTRSDSRNP
jgi:hypothetical protein